ncbi:helix-turn-helix domain-containing protein [Streptomyces prunicolor]|uniref:helix-turn-helix domain-containing protein n=1 Tax=Streptomyces prunicolor TaxID=67348 RepID=UPI0037CEE184
MVALRSRRLEGIFGARLDAVTYPQVVSLVTNAVAESGDLEFKEALYGRSDKAKRDLAADVAALANTVGGVLVLGIQEDDQARAVAVSDVALDNSEQDRIRQIVSELVHPTPAIDVQQVENPQGPGQGFLLVAVPRSVMAPHAVKVDVALRYPRRYGTTTIYLSEAQVAAAYRERFAGFQDRFHDLARLESDLVDRLRDAAQVFVTVTLVPDLAGDFVLDSKSFREFQLEVLNKDPLVIPRGIYFQKALVGSRRLVAHGGATPAAAAYLACELHQSGAGAFAVLVDLPARQDRPAQALSLVDDEDLVLGIWSGLRFLARHARDRAAAGGHAAVRASIWPVSHGNPADLVQLRGLGGSPTSLGRQHVATQPVATGTFDLDDLAEDGTSLVAATSALTAGLTQYFGFPETPQITSDGTIRTRYWVSQRYGTRVQQWAEEAGVKTTDDAID